LNRFPLPPVEEPDGDFLAACTKTEPGVRIQARPLYDAYVGWCRSSDRSALTLTRFGRAITAAGVHKAAGARVHYLDLSLVA
jgi:putative DNA primase/helicase